MKLKVITLVFVTMATTSGWASSCPRAKFLKGQSIGLSDNSVAVTVDKSATKKAAVKE